MSNDKNKNKNKSPRQSSTRRYCIACGGELRKRDGYWMCVRSGCRKYGRKV